jgi:hypothetical protein
MDLDDLKAKWAEHDRKLDTSIRLNRELLREIKSSKARSALQRLAAGLALEVIIDLAAIMALGAFIYANREQGRFAFPAIALDLFAIVILNAQIRQIVGALQIDYGQPVATIQKQLERLRMLRIRCTQWTLLIAPLTWTPLLIVGLKGFYGLDAYRLFGVAWLTANLLVGLAIIPLAIWFSRRYGNRMGRWPIIQRLLRDLAGYNLAVATDFLATLSEFEDEK